MPVSQIWLHSGKPLHLNSILVLLCVLRCLQPLYKEIINAFPTLDPKTQKLNNLFMITQQVVGTFPKPHKILYSFYQDYKMNLPNNHLLNVSCTVVENMMLPINKTLLLAL